AAENYVEVIAMIKNMPGVPQSTNHSRPYLSKPTISALLETILLTPEAVGDPRNRGKGGVAGYFKYCATRDPRAFSQFFLQLLQCLPPPAYGEIEDVTELLAERILGLAKYLKPETSGVGKPSADQRHIDATAPEGNTGQNAP